MRIEEKNKRESLDPMETEQTGELLEASNLLYEVINASFQCSGTCLETIINDQRFNLRDLYWKCKRDMETAEKGGPKTEFLKMSILEDTFKNALPLLLVPVQDLVNGNCRQVETVKQLQDIFKNNIYAERWSKKAEQYREMLTRMGFTVTTDDYKDLTAIMEPLLDAFTLYQSVKGRLTSPIHLVREGIRLTKDPLVMTEVCKYTSEKEFVDAIEGCGKDCVIAFGAVEKTNRQTKDYFYEWYHGYAEEKQRNWMRHDHLTEEEYLDRVEDRTRKIWLCVKCGQEIYLMQMPYQASDYAKISDPSSLYCYGRRAGYAPYAIFYTDLPPASKDTTFLTVPKKGYHLSELMDDMQKVWLPVFLHETMEQFFHAKPNATRMYLPEETCVTIPKIDGGRMEIVPIGQNLPSIHTWTYEAASPERLFQDNPYLLRLIEAFQITAEDLHDVPLCPRDMGSKKAFENETAEKILWAYLKVISNRVEDYVLHADIVRREIVNNIFRHGSVYEAALIEAASQGVYERFSKVIIDGTSILDDQGNQKIIHTDMQDRMVVTHHQMCESAHPKCYWIGEEASARPPVVVKIQTRTREDYEIFYRSLGLEIPKYFELIDEIAWFCEEYKSLRDLRKTKVRKYCNKLADINLCMKKTVYKNWKRAK